MNVIYQYTNMTREKAGLLPCKYIGSKCECTVFNIDGNDLLFENRGDKIYYGSPSRSSYWEHLQQGDTFSVTVLEEVPVRSELREREAYFLEFVDAANNPEYYNMTNNTLHATAAHIDQDAIVNRFGEKYKEYAQRCSNLSKRDNGARELGFDNFGEAHVHFVKELNKGLTGAAISRSFGKHRHYVGVSLRSVDKEKLLRELDYNPLEYREPLRKMVMEGASLQKASEILGLEFSTARIFLGEYHFGEGRRMATAYQLGLTDAEVQVKLMSKVLRGRSVHQASTDMGLNPTTGFRYFYACLRASLSEENLKSGERIT